MAESQKNASISLKDNNLMLDLDIGKDFLSSWKSMSMTEEAAMDFDFAPVSKGKKKIFSFNKADVDFNLDSDFGNISSFKMDMTDLDISSPPEKGTKSKEKSKVESSGGNGKGKTELFNFAFDFDGLASFNFESSFDKDNPKASEKKETFECSSDDSGFQGKEDSSNLNTSDNTTLSEKASQNPLAPMTAIQFDMDYQAGTSDLEPARNHCSSILEIKDPDTSKFSTSIKEGTSDKTKVSTMPTVATTMQQKIIQSEKLMSPDQIDLDACAGNISIPDFSSNGFLNNVPRVGNVTDLLDKVDSLTGSMEDQNANMTSIPKSVCDQYSTSENSYELQSVTVEEKNNEKILGGTEILVKDSKEMTELSQFNSPVENSCITSVIPGPLSDITKSSGNQKEVSPIHVSRQVENLISEDIEPLDTCSRASLESVKAKPHAQKASSTQERVSLLNNQKVSFSHPNVVNGGAREWSSVPGDKRLACLSLERSKTLRSELPQKQNLESFKDLKICGMDSSADGVKYERKMINLSATKNQEAVKTKSSLGQGKGRMKELHTFSLNLDSLKSPSLTGVHSSTNVGQKSVISRKLPADISHISDPQKQTLSTLSLKRKAVEESNADLTVLNPSKRFSDWPDGRRNFVELPEKVLDKKVSTFDTPRKDHFGGPEISFSAGCDTNIKQAEAYTKELDKICSMLRKKQAEAKEILVRSIVNSNKLLLLNHALFKKNIYFKLQPFYLCMSNFYV